jgi:hypothetical protein
LAQADLNSLFDDDDDDINAVRRRRMLMKVSFSLSSDCPHAEQKKAQSEVAEKPFVLGTTAPQNENFIEVRHKSLPL